MFGLFYSCSPGIFVGVFKRTARAWFKKRGRVDSPFFSAIVLSKTSRFPRSFQKFSRVSRRFPCVAQKNRVLCKEDADLPHRDQRSEQPGLAGRELAFEDSQPTRGVEGSRTKGWTPKNGLPTGVPFFHLLKNRVVGSLGVFPHCDTRQSPPSYGGLVFGKPFLLYHRSGHSPQPCLRICL